MITTTIEELHYKLEILNKVDLSVNDKLTHAVKRIKAQYTKQTRMHAALMNDKVQNVIRIPNAAVDEGGRIITQKTFENPDKDGFRFEPKKLVFVNQECQKQYDAYNNTIITIEGFMCPDINEGGWNRLVDRKDSEGKLIPAILDEFEKEELAGILFPVIEPADNVVSMAISAEAAPDQRGVENV